jgi:hypothetical protein
MHFGNVYLAPSHANQKGCEGMSVTHTHTHLILSHVGHASHGCECKDEGECVCVCVGGGGGGGHMDLYTRGLALGMGPSRGTGIIK